MSATAIETATPVSRSLGMSPRIVPRPLYPSLSEVVLTQAKTLLWTSGLLGTLLALACYPLYEIAVAKLQAQGYSEALVFTIVLNAIHTLVWLVVNVPLLYFDAQGLFAKFKMHRAPGQVPSTKMVMENIVTSLVMQLTVNPLLGYYLFHSHWSSLGMLPMTAPLPASGEIFKSIIIAHLFNDVFFYATHRLFHSKPLYFLHKQHHTFAGTIGPAAEYANPVEVVVANLFPTFYGCLLFGCKHPLVLMTWFAMRLQETYMAHSGYCFENTLIDVLGLAHTDTVAHHDHHHTSNRGNFGALYLDWLFGTMDAYAAIGGHAGYLQRGKQARKRVD